MTLTPVQQQKLVVWMSSKGVKLTCAACGTPDSWSPGDIVASGLMKPGGLHINGSVTPMLEIICDNCAHVTYFAAEPMGIYERGRHGRSEHTGPKSSR